LSTTTGLTYEQARAKQAALKAQGKTLSTSKEMGKLEDYIKTLKPQNYDKNTVAAAQTSLKLKNEPVVSGIPGTTPSAVPTGSTTTPGATLPGTGIAMTDLDKQLADKQAALVKATSNINDNPWYSEATRTGKLAKLNNIAQLDITNLQNAISQKKTDEQNAFNNNITTQNMALSQQKANQPNVSVVTNNDGTVTGYDSMTGKVMYTLPGAGASKTTGGGSTASEKQNYSSQMVDAISTIKTQTAAMGITYEGGGSYITINQAKPLIEEWTKLGFTEADWWNRFGSSVLGGKP
jgi:hypothetical protein